MLGDAAAFYFGTLRLTVAILYSIIYGLYVAILHTHTP